MSEPLLVEREGGLVHLKLNRPQVLNALNQAMADALLAAARAIEADGSVRAVLITAPTPVITPQPTSVARSSGISRSIFTSAFSCTSSCSAKAERLRNWCIGSPPRQDRRRDWPGCIFTSVFSHSTVRPWVHCWQAPQKTLRQPIT